MKSTGIVRRTDDLGRIVIPKELRRNLRIKEGDPLEIFMEGSYIMLRKYEPTCIFCGEAKELSEYKGKKICQSCREIIGGNSIWKGELKWKNMKL